MKNLKKFETTSQYEAYTADTANFIKPNVSLCKDGGGVHYNLYDPYNGYEYVDLGLPRGVKWAKYNVGATNETEYGNFYQYGRGADQYAATWKQPEYSGTEDPLATSADTAAQVWGGDWHMPTSTQLYELTANTTYTWETNFNGSGINGGKFTARNGNYIFFPAAGNYNYGGHLSEGVYSNVWSSSLDDGNVLFLWLYDVVDYPVSRGGRQAGYSVRPVIG